MDKLSLLEKLKTQKWQLQHHLNNSSMKEASLEPLHSSDDENKENTGVPSRLHVNNDSIIGKQMFLDRVHPNILAQALKQANLSCSKNSDGAFQEREQENGSGDQYPGNGDVNGPENGSLEHWNMSGLQTVVLGNGVPVPQLSNHDEITPIKSGHDEANYGEQYYEYSESEDGFSEVGGDDFVDYNGCKPLSETSDDEEIPEPHEFSESPVDNSEHAGISSGPAVADIFMDNIENTVIELSNSQRAENNEDKPITPGVSRNRSFQEMLDDKISEEQSTISQKSQISEESKAASSTPVKSKARKFLKRGEGLKRFQCGEYSKGYKGWRKPEEKDKKTKKLNKEVRKVPQGKSALATTTAPSKNVPKFDQNVPQSTPSLKVPNTKGILKKATQNENAVVVQNNTRYGERKSSVPPSVESASEMHTEVLEFNQYLKSTATDENRKVTFGDELDSAGCGVISVTESADISFRRMLQDRFKHQEREAEELDMFEALEEAAENTSLSSNCSLVLRHFGHANQPNTACDSNAPDLQSQESQPAKTTPSFDFDDEASWSDDGIQSADEKEDTVVGDDSSSDEAPDLVESPPPKRIISKKKVDEPMDPVKTVVEPSTVLESINVSDIVKKKLAELEKEITKYRSENDKLLDLRTERESGLKHLRKEIDTFQKEKAEELKRIEEYKTEEMKKIKNERKLFDKYQKEIKAAPSKEEREEIRELKAEVAKFKEEVKNKESKWNAASHRFRTRITELEDDNNELRDEIKLLEKQRLERWTSAEAPVNKTKISDVVSHSGNSSPLPTTHPSSKSASGPSLDEQYGLQNVKPTQTKEVDSEHSYHLPTHIGTMNNTVKKSVPHQKETKHADGKVEVLLPDQSRVITFPNGTKKTISKDEKTVTVAFFNGDMKKTIDGKLVYYYSESQTTHTTFPDGLEMLEFPNGQTEKRHPDGKTEVIFPDATVKVIHTDGTEETTFTDGTVQTLGADGVRVISFANGQREIHTVEYKRREYPNGTVKTVYVDGKQETKYSNGRIRVKDSAGNLVMDTGVA